MKVTLKLYATLTDFLPTEARQRNALELDLEPGTTVTQVIAAQNLPQKLCHLVLIDGLFIPPGERDMRILADGETLAIWPPIAGG
jgi:sulfur carrier protein ThiS